MKTKNISKTQLKVYFGIGVLTMIIFAVVLFYALEEAQEAYTKQKINQKL